jgi:nudix-type nucleoside diphosphatase (YffH/AdpP family)
MVPSIIETRTLYEGFVRLLSARVRMAGGEVAVREIEDHGRAVAILPYDPQRRTLLFVRLLRAPPLLAEGVPDLIEAPAGLMEDGERPEDAALREAREETGYALQTPEPLASAWTSPGISTERMDLFAAAYAPGDRVSDGGGAPGEHENALVVELDASQALAMIGRGEIADMKTLALILLLRTRRPALFEPAG